jgi:NTP pyrophosphatase (non-canonical NTP hydrolase)
MSAPTFERVWETQENFYKDRPLMWSANQDVVTLLNRLRMETTECEEEITKCMAAAGTEGVVDLCAQQIRQEISDLFLFVTAIARCCGLSGTDLLADAMEKIARNMGRYNAQDFQDTTVNYDDQAEKSRSFDKRRGFTKDFYAIAA